MISNIPSLYAGDTKNLVVTIYDENSNVVDITGASFKWKLESKQNYISKDSTTGGITVTEPTQGIVVVHLVPEDTINLSGVYYHELEMTDDSGNVSTVLQDKIHIKSAFI